MDEVLIFGGAVKALGGGKVGGYLVTFSTSKDPDITGSRDFFTPETDYDLERSIKATVMYDHGLDPVLKKRKLGIGEMKVDAVGVWIESQLELRDDYERAVYELAEAGKLGWSSGTAPHLVERKKLGNANQIMRWPLGLDASLTPTPAEPRNSAISLKSYAQDRARGGAKGLYALAVADRIPPLYQPVDTLTSVLSQLEWIAMSANGTALEVDFAAEIDSVLAEFQQEMREVALRRITAYSTKSADAVVEGDSSPDKNYGKLELSLPLLTHSKAVRDAARGLIERLQGLHAQRSEREGKSRTLNEQHTQNLEELASDLEQAAKSARALTEDVSAKAAVRRARVEYQRITARTLGVRPS